MIEALAERGPFGIIHIDAHMDWANYPGRPYCHSKTMRRASECEHVIAMAQLGIRAFTYTSIENYRDAVNYGSKIFSARMIRERGVAAIAEELPRCDKYYVSIDMDGLDATLAPATGSSEVCGLSYEELQDILKAVAKLGEVIGFDIVELAPPLDLPAKPTCKLAAKIIREFLAYIMAERTPA